MKSFLITFKPLTENRARGWPLEKLQQIAGRCRLGEVVEETWRFKNRREVSVGDRVFLVLQGKAGPAIIGYGKVEGEPQNSAGKWQVLTKFEAIVDPTIEVLANKEDLLPIVGGRRFWRIQSSGVLLPEPIAAQLESLVVGKPSKLAVTQRPSNPNWTQDELILALDVYLRYRPNLPGKESKTIVELSELLNRLGEKLFSQEERTATFRNESGAYMKLMNFRRLDPQYRIGGKLGLSRGAMADARVWAEFSGDPVRCHQVVKAIVASLDDVEVASGWVKRTFDDDIQEGPEGRLLTRQHLVRERNSRLVESKKKQSMKRNGKLACEVCDFDFAIYYGERGHGFIECHHTKPLATLGEGRTTHINDLALVCANCHRIIHRGKQWLSVTELKDLMNNANHRGDGFSGGNGPRRPR